MTCIRPFYLSICLSVYLSVYLSVSPLHRASVHSHSAHNHNHNHNHKGTTYIHTYIDKK